MTDCFALLEIARRPGVDDQQVKAAYFRLAAVWHPDAAGGDAGKFRQLQDAYRTLKDPAARLRHLAELTFGSSEAGSAAPARQVGLFLEVGALLQEVEVWKKRTAGSRTSLARALLQEERQTLCGRVKAAQETVKTHLVESGRELAALDARWPGVGAEALQSLATELRFLQRWKTALAGAGLVLETAS